MVLMTTDKYSCSKNYDEDFSAFYCADRGFIQKRRISMQVAKQSVHNLVEALPASLLPEVANFILFIKMRDESGLYKGLEALSVSSMDFWNNDIDDEVWNDV